MTLKEIVTKYNIKSVFHYASAEEKMMEEQASENGYTRKTTFYSDLSIAEWCDGAKGIKDTYNRVVKEWKKNKTYFTEFVLCLNWKCWEWYGRENEEWSRLYSDLYYKACQEVEKNFSEEDKSYFYEVTD